MKRQTFGRLLGRLALLGPIAAPVYAADNAERPGVHIYSAESVFHQATIQDQVAPEQAVPRSTESREAAAPAANGAPKEETVGTLQAWLQCNGCGQWLECNRIKVSGHIEQGYTINEDSPHDRQNFGRLFDDRSNDYRFNQAILTFERALDPQPCCTDWGFKAQFMYGSDARFIHYLGEFDNFTNATVQPDIVELYLNYHLPVLTAGGVDVKVGQFVTLMGMDVIYAPANALYSHNYIFNFGIPFKHTGVMVTTHLTDQIDVMTGLVGGINTGLDDNNDAIAFHGGVTWTSCDKNATIAASLHVGPENDGFFNTIGIDSNDDMRTIFDLVSTIKFGECLTWVTDFNVGRDDGFDAEWYGVASQVIYKLSNCTSLVVRGEVFRDDDAFAVAQFAKNDDFINIERGDIDDLDRRTVSGGATTYGELTIGLNVKPYENLLFRPEVRWDWASGNKPFNNSSDNDMFTLGMDMIWSF